VTAPAQLRSGHQTGAETQQTPGKASWASTTVARRSRMDSRRVRHSRAVQQPGSAACRRVAASVRTEWGIERAARRR
jgi:hypothetical protein